MTDEVRELLQAAAAAEDIIQDIREHARADGGRAVSEQEQIRIDQAERIVADKRAKAHRIEREERARIENMDVASPRDRQTAATGAALRTGRWEELEQRSDYSVRSPFESTEEFLRAVLTPRHDPRLDEVRAQSTLVDELGGFAVPSPLARQIVDTALESEVVRPRARIFPLTSRTLNIPLWSNFDHSSDTLYGGIQASWTAEGGTITPQDAKLQQLALAAHKLTLLSRVSNEVASYSDFFVRELQTALTGAMSWQLDNHFLNGTGGPQPEGILNSPALVTVAAEGSQAAATINYDNVVKMFSRMHTAGKDRAIWIVNPDSLPQLLTMSLAIGTGGSAVPVLHQGDSGMTLLSRPVITSEKCATLGTVGDILFCDFSQYAIGLAADIRIDTTSHFYFNSDELGVRLKIHVDGKSMWPTPLTPAKGAATLSPFVALATRA